MQHDWTVRCPLGTPQCVVMLALALTLVGNQCIAAACNAPDKHWHWLSISIGWHQCTPKMSVFGHNSIIVDSFSHVWRLICTLSGLTFWLSTFGCTFVWASANFWQFKCHPKLCHTPKLAFLIYETNQIDWANWTNWLTDQPADWLGQSIIQLVGQLISWLLSQSVGSLVSWLVP